MTVLIADDDSAVLRALSLLLNSEKIESVACRTPADVLEKVSGASFQLALLDLNYHKDTTSGKEGLELISKIKEIDSNLPIIVMTGWGTVDIAVEAMKRGAVDFIEKPWEQNSRLVTTIRTQIKLRETSDREQKLREENSILKKEQLDTDQLVCESPAIKKVLDMAERIASSKIPVLIIGENGTGKSLLAKYIHEKSSCADGPFVAVNMGGISDSIFESEMFGHVKGAYTDARTERIGRVELAEGGTLFMDEIANMPTQQQAKILRLLEEFKYERLGSSQTRAAAIRVISATNADLGRLTNEHGFRQDLLYRLNGITLEVPPLRNRKQDIMPLALHTMKKARQHYQSPARKFSESAIDMLMGYEWPGNVRELQHVIERAVLLSGDVTVQSADLQLGTQSINETSDSLNAPANMTLSEAEAWYIQLIIDQHDGNLTKVAKTLDISRSALYRRIGKSRP